VRAGFRWIRGDARGASRPWITNELAVGVARSDGNQRTGRGIAPTLAALTNSHPTVHAVGAGARRILAHVDRAAHSAIARRQKVRVECAWTGAGRTHRTDGHEIGRGAFNVDRRHVGELRCATNATAVGGEHAIARHIAAREIWRKTSRPARVRSSCRATTRSARARSARCATTRSARARSSCRATTRSARARSSCRATTRSARARAAHGAAAGASRSGASGTTAAAFRPVVGLRTAATTDDDGQK
jgi:hypothetical protein